MGHVYGYARVSTDDQDLALQMRALIAHGVSESHIFKEHASGKTVRRPVLDRLLRTMRDGDKLVVWKLDRLGRDLTGVLGVIKSLGDQDIEFASLTEAFDTKTPMGKAFMQIALVFAELERNMISERTTAGMAAARAAGSKFGRAHTIRDSAKRIERLREMDAAGELRSEAGILIPKAADLVAELNKAKHMGKGDKLINNPETVRRWTREGYAGLAASTDDKKEQD